MSIQIHIDAPSAEIALDEMRKLLGANAIKVEWKQVGAAAMTEVGERIAATQEAAEAPDASHIATQENSGVVTPAPTEKKTRQRKPKDAPASSVSSTDNGGQTDIETAIAEQAAISTGNERVGPEDTPEVVAQDEVDEKAESDAARDPAKPVTLDDVRSALGDYVRQYGMENAQVDGPKVISMVCGEGKVKVSDIPDDKIAAVVSGVKEMSEKNPFKREKVAA